MNKPRLEIDQKDTWDLSSLYEDFATWEKEFSNLVSQKDPLWPFLKTYQKSLNKSASHLKDFLILYFQTERALAKLYTYAHLKHDEDITNDRYKIIFNESLTSLQNFQQECAWIEPELLALDDSIVKNYLEDPLLAPFKLYLSKIFRLKPHTLSFAEELLLARASKALMTSSSAFSAINDADFKFLNVLDSQNKEHPLTHASYSLYLRSPDRNFRKNTFDNYYLNYQGFENTLAELLNGQIQSHIFNAKARHFNSALEASLFPKKIDLQVYNSLIEAVHQKISSLHRYMEIRSKVLNLTPLHFYDMQVPLTKNFDMNITYQEAEKLVIESVTPLGQEYQEILQKGFQEKRWVDRYENQNKRSGAYSSGCFDSEPYILMNYKNTIRDVFTLAHEAGHSMHSYYSRKNQPYPYSDYSIFVAEVASTFNEELLMQLMLKKAQTKEEKIFLINQKIEDIKGTLFRQTQFAEFEKLIHQLAEQEIPLTPKLLNDEYLKINQFYYGPNVAYDIAIANEWARIPHFYYNFYVFQYATGISAALTLADLVTKEANENKKENKAQAAYLNFLKSGSSLYPIDALKLAGVDMLSIEPVKQAIFKFDHLMDELEALI